MKLSKVEELVKAMREYATEHGVADPNVAFWLETNPVRVFDIRGNVQQRLAGHVVDRPGANAEVGDFHFPLFRDE